MLFFKNRQEFKKTLSLFEEGTGILVINTNSNGPVGNQWGVNFVNTFHNEEFRKFVEGRYNVVSNNVGERII